MIQKFSRQKNIFGYLENRFVKFSERLLYKTATLIFCHSPKDETLIPEYLQREGASHIVVFRRIVAAHRLQDDRSQGLFCNVRRLGTERNTEGLTWFPTRCFRTPRLNIKIIDCNMPSDVRRKIDETDRVEYLGFVENRYGYIAEAQRADRAFVSRSRHQSQSGRSVGLGTPALGSAVAWEGSISTCRSGNIPASSTRRKGTCGF